MDYTMSDDGRYMPALNRFPSAAGGKGFRPLADWVHSQGLKFGIHIIRGIPRDAVNREPPHRRLALHAPPKPPTPPTHANGIPTTTASRTTKPPRPTTTPSPTSTPMGRRLPQSRLHLPSLEGRRDSHDAATLSTRPAAPSSSASRPAPRPSKTPTTPVRSAQLWRISDDMWDLWSKPARRSAVPAIGKKPVRAPREVAALRRARSLARRRHAPHRLPRSHTRAGVSRASRASRATKSAP